MSCIKNIDAIISNSTHLVGRRNIYCRIFDDREIVDIALLEITGGGFDQ